MAAEATKTTLNQHSCALLAQILAMPGWTDKHASLFRAGQILEERLPSELPPQPSRLLKPGDEITPEQKAQQIAWSKAPVIVELTPRQRETIAECVKHFVTAKQLYPSYHLLPLLTLAGLEPED